MKYIEKHSDGEFTITEHYRTSNDRVYVRDVNEVKSIIKDYIGLSKTFSYCDWYGNERQVKATITKLWVDSRWNKGYHYWYAEVSLNREIPLHYAPSLARILKGVMRFPICSQTLSIDEFTTDNLEEL